MHDMMAWRNTAIAMRLAICGPVKVQSHVSSVCEDILVVCRAVSEAFPGDRKRIDGVIWIAKTELPNDDTAGPKLLA
jgi:hypothetical protein